MHGNAHMKPFGHFIFLDRPSSLKIELNGLFGHAWNLKARRGRSHAPVATRLISDRLTSKLIFKWLTPRSPRCRQSSAQSVERSSSAWRDSGMLHKYPGITFIAHPLKNLFIAKNCMMSISGNTQNAWSCSHGREEIRVSDLWSAFQREEICEEAREAGSSRGKAICMHCLRQEIQGQVWA